MEATYITGAIRAFLPLLFTYCGYELSDGDLTLLSAALGGVISTIWSIYEKKSLKKKRYY